VYASRLNTTTKGNWGRKGGEVVPWEVFGEFVPRYLGNGQIGQRGEGVNGGPGGRMSTEKDQNLWRPPRGETKKKQGEGG